jgi:hypothetical protein
MTKSNIKKAITDFEWVVKILESSEDENHLKVTLRCFSLWDSKYSDSSLTSSESNVLTKLKLNFWSLYKDKNSIIGTISI